MNKHQKINKLLLEAELAGPPELTIEHVFEDMGKVHVEADLDEGHIIIGMPSGCQLRKPVIEEDAIAIFTEAASKLGALLDNPAKFKVSIFRNPFHHDMSREDLVRQKSFLKEMEQKHKKIGTTNGH